MMVNHNFGGGVYAKEVKISAGHTLVQHIHKFDHLSILAAGTARVIVDGAETEYHAPSCVLIAGGKRHGLQAVTDIVWYCIHATDETDAAKADAALIVDSGTTLEEGLKQLCHS